MYQPMDKTGNGSYYHKLTNSPNNDSPVVFIPGIGGSQLEARLDKTEKVNHFCASQSDWYHLWFNIRLLVQPFLDCLIDNMRSHYDPIERKTRNTAGVQIRPTNFCSLDTVDHINIFKLPKTGYFSDIISALEKNNGYTRNVDMVGASFDFRKAPNELGGFFLNLTQLIESTYAKNGFKKVTLICHSVGCLNSIYLLNSKSQNWKDVYIRRLISIAAPYGGSLTALKAMLYGDDFKIPFADRRKFRHLQASFPSLAFLLPRKPAISEDKILIQTDTNNYTLKNLDLLFNDTGMIDQREMWHDTREIAANLAAPNVELWCLYGTGIETPDSIVHYGDFKQHRFVDEDYQDITSDGDGTVTVESALVCEEFRKNQDKPVFVNRFHKANHRAILKGAAVEFISKYIF